MSKTQLSHSDIVPSKLQRGRPRKFRSGSNSEVTSHRSLFDPEQRTSTNTATMSEKCHQRTRAEQHKVIWSIL